MPVCCHLQTLDGNKAVFRFENVEGTLLFIVSHIGP